MVWNEKKNKNFLYSIHICTDKTVYVYWAQNCSENNKNTFECALESSDITLKDSKYKK